MPEKRTLFKVGCGAVAASAIAAGVVFEILQSEKISQFNTDGKMSAQDYEFMSYVSTYGKSYPTKSEYKMRASNYAVAGMAINKHNADPNATSKCGHNHLSTMTETELKSTRGYSSNLQGGFFASSNTDVSLGTDPPAASGIDWTQKGMVTAIQNQGNCGSCWSFSAAGCIGSRRAIAGYPLVDYSEQQLVDCSTQNNGCKGGIMDAAFEYVEKSPLETTANYPYTSGTTKAAGSCTYSASKGTGTISGYTNVPVNSVSALKNALATGPVSVAVEADQTAFQYYTSGVVTTGCGTALDHGILAVGWGTDSTTGTEYFLVKNQWGASWGLDGYIQIGALASNVCGILSYPSFVTVA